MNAHHAYRRNQPAPGHTRIDLLLALFDGAIDRIDRAAAALRADDRPRALPLLIRAQAIVMELAAGVRLDVDEAMGTNVLRLYEYAAHELARQDADGADNAARVLGTLRDGFRGVRDEAVELERSGQVPAVDDLAVLAVQA